jgi:hypothetical protein
MADKSMPHHYWAEAITTAIYIINRTPTVTVHGMTPEEKYSGKKTKFVTLESVWVHYICTCTK